MDFGKFCEGVVDDGDRAVSTAVHAALQDARRVSDADELGVRPGGLHKFQLDGRNGPRYAGNGEVLSADLDDRILSGEAEIAFYTLPSQRTGQIVNEYLRHEGLHFDNVIYTSNMPAIIDLVSAGYGAAFIFEPHLRHHSTAHLVDCYSFGEPRMVSKFAAAYRKGGYLPVYAKDFIELTRQLYWKV